MTYSLLYLLGTDTHFYVETAPDELLRLVEGSLVDGLDSGFLALPVIDWLDEGEVLRSEHDDPAFFTQVGYFRVDQIAAITAPGPTVQRELDIARRATG